jgi:hypothetical protein
MRLARHIAIIILSDHICLGRTTVHITTKIHLNMSKWFHHIFLFTESY